MRIPFHTPFSTGREADYVAEALRGQLSGNGPFTKRAQALLRERYDAPAVLLTHSCTGALELAAMAADLRPGDEVIVPSYTFPSTAAAFARVGARVVFADVDPATMALDPDDLRRRITPATRAVCPVHYAGAPFDVHAISAICEQAGLLLIEDAAQALDARHDGRPLGTIGELAAFSFHETKNLHCGLGGALVINDPERVRRTEYIWERGTNRAEFLRGHVDKYTWVEVGGSFYPSEMQAAFLLAQLEAIDDNTARRRALWDRYDARLRPLARPDRFHVQHLIDGAETNGHAVFLRLTSEAACDALRDALHAQGIDARTHFVPLHTSPAGARIAAGADGPAALPHTERWAPAILRLPMHNALSDADVDHVCDAVASFFDAR